MKISPIFILLFFSSILGFSSHYNFILSQPVQQVWVRTYDSLPGSSSSMALDSMQNIIVTGTIQLTGGRTDWCTIKYSTAGVQSWTDIYDGIPTSNGINSPTATGVDQQGNIYVTGYSERSGFGTDDYCTIKYNSNGVQQWISKYNTGIGSKNDASAIAIDNSRNVYVTGYSTGNGTGYDIATIKYNSNGDSLWVRRYDDPQHLDDVAYSIALDNSGNVFVCGGIGNTNSILTIKYNSSGAQQWVNFGGMGFLKKIKIDNNGNSFVTGIEQIGTILYYVTIKYNSNGVQQWKSDYNYLGTNYSSDYSNDLALDNQGNVFVTGRSLGSETNWDYATIKYNSAGVQQWVQRYNGTGNDYDEAYTIFTDSIGNIYITGLTWGNGSNNCTTIKYSSSGVQQWLISSNGTYGNGAGGNTILLDKQNNVYVSGGNALNNSVYFLTIKYSQLNPINKISEHFPQNFELKQNYPNPFNPNTEIRYYLSNKSYVNLDIFDIVGRKICALINCEQNAGEYKYNFNGSNLSSGIYLYRLTALNDKENFTDSKIMILEK